MAYDVAIIGAGPGGYVAAIRAGQLGLKVCCIEKREDLGGTCLNVGCIPSKALLQSTEHLVTLRDHGQEHGIEASSVKMNFKKLMERKTGIISQFRQGIKGLFRKNKVDLVNGSAKLVSGTSIEVTKADGSKETVEAKSILLATGSDSIHLPFLPVDEERVITSTGALSLKKVPKKLVVIGGGVIGVEMASVYARLGSDVTVVEMMDMICPGMDMAARKALLTILEGQGLKFHLSTKVASADVGKSKIKIQIEKGDKAETLECDTVLVSVGRRAYSDGLGLDELGITRDQRGVVQVNSCFQTNVPSVYAIGDLIDGPMLAHKASEEGVAVVEHLAGHKAHVNYLAIPGVVYTSPEAASVGMTEEDAKAAGFEVCTGSFPFKASSRARCIGDDAGLVKVIGCKKTGAFLGMHIVGHAAGEMIAMGALAIEKKATLSELAELPLAHPTLSEAMKEAAMGCLGSPIHC